ncbi:MAG: hypothetical protein IPP93_05460 [Chitinophagaceae bacterium]|nr:hypothetical protein [Chitinophagaceae bacterium]
MHQGFDYSYIMKKDIVDIWVEDDGDGFDQSFIKGKDSKKISAGLLNMQKRAELLNGHYSLESTPGKGTKINILIPY